MGTADCRGSRGRPSVHYKAVTLRSKVSHVAPRTCSARCEVSMGLDGTTQLGSCELLAADARPIGVMRLSGEFFRRELSDEGTAAAHSRLTPRRREAAHLGEQSLGPGKSGLPSSPGMRSRCRLRRTCLRRSRCTLSGLHGAETCRARNCWAQCCRRSNGFPPGTPCKRLIARGSATAGRCRVDSLWAPVTPRGSSFRAGTLARRTSFGGSTRPVGRRRSTAVLAAPTARRSCRLDPASTLSTHSGRV